LEFDKAFLTDFDQAAPWTIQINDDKKFKVMSARVDENIHNF
jgi:hypothetical protein